MTVPRPFGVAAGGLGLLLAWGGGAAIARLTGSTPVVIVLAAGAVWFLASVLAGWVGVISVRVDSVTVPPLAPMSVCRKGMCCCSSSGGSSP